MDKEYIDQIYNDATGQGFIDIESERIAKNINVQLANKHVIVKHRSVGLTGEIYPDQTPVPKKYTKSQIGQAVANLKRAKRAGKQLTKKQKAQRRKYEAPHEA